MLKLVMHEILSPDGYSMCDKKPRSYPCSAYLSDNCFLAIFEENFDHKYFVDLKEMKFIL